MNKLYLLLVFTTLLIYYCNSRPLSPKKVVWAINAGALQSKRAHQGFIFDQDKDYDFEQKTVSVDYSTDNQYNGLVIKYTKDQEVYMTERHSYQSFKYYVPIKADGKYVLILKFCEMYFTQANKRVFNIRFGQERVIKDLDIVNKARGRAIAHDEYIEFELKGNNILIKGKPIPDAFIDGKLHVEFEKTEKDNPIVNGLILYQGSLVDTDFFELDMYRQEWEKEYKAEQRRKKQEQEKKQQPKEKKKEKIKIRNDHLDEMEEEYEEVEQVKEKTVQKEIPPLKDLLMTPLGVVAMIGFFVSAFVLVYFTFFDPYGIEKRKREDLKKERELEAASGKKVGPADNNKNE